MNTRQSSRGASADLRRDRALWPYPLTTSGRAVACPTCLPSGSNQHNLEGSSLLDLPIERDVCCACVPPQLGGSIPECLAFFSAPWRIIAPDSLICGHCLGEQAVQFLSRYAFADVAKEQTFPDLLGLLCPFFPSLPCRDARLRAQRIGGFIGMPPDGRLHSLLALDPCDPLPPPGQYSLSCPLSWLPDKMDVPANGPKTNPSSPPWWGGQTGGHLFHLSSFWNHTTRLSVRHTHPAEYRCPNHQGKIRLSESVSMTPAHQEKTSVLWGVLSLSPAPGHLVFSDLFGDFPLPDVIQDSDFRTKITLRKKSVFFRCPSVRQAYFGRFHNSATFSHPFLKYLTSLSIMAYPKKSPAVQFHVDCSAEAKSRFATLHEALGFKTKAATFEAVLFSVSLKDKIDPQILHRLETKLDRVLEHLDDIL